LRPPPTSPLFPYTTLFRSRARDAALAQLLVEALELCAAPGHRQDVHGLAGRRRVGGEVRGVLRHQDDVGRRQEGEVGVCAVAVRSEEHTSELQSLTNLVCR